MIFDIDKRLHSAIRSRHEIVSETLKNFNVLKGLFRHHRHLHSCYFYAIVRITQLVIRNECPLRSILKINILLQFLTSITFCFYIQALV